MKKIIVSERIFKSKVTLFYECTLQELKNEYRCGDMEASECNGRFHYNEEDNSCIIWIKDITKEELIAHELIHFIFHILDDLGIPTTKENDEVFAYIYAYYFKEIKKKLIVI